ncbi:MAG: acyl carrier protein [Firmicutes bacterium]|nr:acyl carrier protein [Bacillota bacterium]
MFDEIKSILIDELDVDEALITPDANFVEDLKLNSLELADLVVLCEEKYNIEIEEDELHSLITIGDLTDYIEEKKAE